MNRPSAKPPWPVSSGVGNTYPGVDLRDVVAVVGHDVDVREPGRGVVHQVGDRRGVLRIASAGDPEDRIAERLGMADQVDHPWRCREHVPRERRARQADEVGVRRRVEVPVAVELVVPGGQRRVVDVEHDRPVRDLRPRGEPVVAFLGDRTSLVRVIAVEIQRGGPRGGRAGSRDGGRRAVVVLGPGASDVDVRQLRLGLRRVREVRGLQTRDRDRSGCRQPCDPKTDCKPQRAPRRRKTLHGYLLRRIPFPKAETLRNTCRLPVHRRRQRSIIR